MKEMKATGSENYLWLSCQYQRKVQVPCSFSLAEEWKFRKNNRERERNWRSEGSQINKYWGSHHERKAQSTQRDSLWVASKDPL